jgi:hypothetical protein
MADDRTLTLADRSGIELDMIDIVLVYALNQRACYEEGTPEYIGLNVAVGCLKQRRKQAEHAYRAATQQQEVQERKTPRTGREDA